MSRCPKCHEQIEVDWLVCAYCGTRLSPGVSKKGQSPSLAGWLMIGGSVVFLIGVIFVGVVVLGNQLVNLSHIVGLQTILKKSEQTRQGTPTPQLDHFPLALTSTDTLPNSALGQSAGFSLGFGNQAYVWGKGRINRVIFSLDAGFIVIGSTKGVEILDSKSFSNLVSFPTPDEVIDIAISLDGTTVGVSLNDGTVIAFDAHTGEKINQWTVDLGLVVYQLLITPDGSRLIGYTAYNLYAWDLKSDKSHLIAGGMFSNSSRDYSMSTSGEQFSIGSYYGVTGGGRMSDKWREFRSNGIIFTESGPVLLRSIPGMTNGDLIVYFDEQKQTWIRYQPGDATEHFVLSHDSQILAGYAYNQVTLWNTQTGERLQSYKIDWGEILDMQFDSQNQLWGTSLDISGVYTWSIGDLQNPQFLDWSVADKGSSLDLFFMPGTNSEIIMATQSESIQLIDFKTNTLLNRLPDGTPYTVFIDGSLLTFTNEKFLRLNPYTGKEIDPVTPCGEEGLTFLSGLVGQFTLCQPQDGKQQVWDLYTNSVHSILVSQEPPFPILSPQGNLILSTGGEDRQIIETSTGKVRSLLPGFPIYSAPPLFSKDERYLVARISKTQLSVFNTSTGQAVGPVITINTYPQEYDFSPDSEFLAVGDHEGGVTLWHPGESTPFFTYQPHTRGIILLKISPDGNYIATSSFDGTIVVWNVSP